MDKVPANVILCSRLCLLQVWVMSGWPDLQSYILFAWPTTSLMLLPFLTWSMVQSRLFMLNWNALGLNLTGPSLRFQHSSASAVVPTFWDFTSEWARSIPSMWDSGISGGCLLFLFLSSSLVYILNTSPSDPLTILCKSSWNCSQHILSFLTKFANILSTWCMSGLSAWTEKHWEQISFCCFLLVPNNVGHCQNVPDFCGSVWQSPNQLTLHTWRGCRQNQIFLEQFQPCKLSIFYPSAAKRVIFLFSTLSYWDCMSSARAVVTKIDTILINFMSIVSAYRSAYKTATCQSRKTFKLIVNNIFHEAIWDN